MKIEILNNISALSEQNWQRLDRQKSLFSNYRFFQCLEASGSVNRGKGWQPHHLQLSDQQSQVKAILPMYVKSHSWGEYVFDWAWADAYQHNNLPYYPKLVATTPFTPVTGDKLLAEDIELSEIFELLNQHCLQQQLNSWHILYCQNSAHASQNQANDVYQRNTVQFHWLNNNYGDFDEFLSNFTARKRKNTRKERQSITQQNINVRRITGQDINEKELAFFYLTYQLTYLKRGHTPHLTFEFFQLILQQLPEHVLLIIANCNGEDIACAWYFYDDKQLYGRYWGCTKSYNNLHFELCYYQGIEFCIERKLSLFHPGTQGEHKIARGFEPKLTTSYHWVKHTGFRPAIKAFCLEEQQQMLNYQAHCQQLLPFKSTEENNQ